MRTKNRDDNSIMENEDDSVGIIDPRHNIGPEVLGQNPISVKGRTTNNQQADSFNEIGRALEGQKDSPLDKRNVHEKSQS